MIAEKNVVVRLKQTLQRARATGFRVRMEVLDDEQATWCVIAGKPTLFVDLSQTAAEQLQQVEETLATYVAEQKRDENLVVAANHSNLGENCHRDVPDSQNRAA